MNPRTRDQLASAGYFRGDWYGDDPNKPTRRWLVTDGAGSATPVSEFEEALIALFLGRGMSDEARRTLIDRYGGGVVADFDAAYLSGGTE